MSLIARLTKHLTLDLSLTPAAKARTQRPRTDTRAAHQALKTISDRVHAELRAAVKS